MTTDELEKCIDLEIVKTEKRRLEIFLGVSVFAFLLLVFNITFFPVSISDVFLNPKSINFGVVVTFGFIVLLLVSRLLVGKLVSCDRPLPLWYKIYSLFMESFVPIIWLCLIIAWEKNAAFLDSPLIFFYIPILIVSALHLNFWLSFFNGFFVSLVFGVITYWSFSNYGESMFFPSIVYYTKAIIFLLSGICGGFVARELKKRLTISVKTQEERDEIESLFSQQVSRQVVEALKSRRDYSIKTEATVLFLDIRDFTKRVQNMSPEEVNKFQNKFFGPFIECISKCGGMIHQLYGDGLMATFGSAQEEKHHERAFRAAKNILKKLETLQDDFDDPVRIGIGIHSGEIIAGNIGTTERQQFSISGIPVITAARLEQLTKEYNCTLLVSYDFYQKIKHLASNGTSLGNVKMKGLDQEIEIIKII